MRALISSSESRSAPATTGATSPSAVSTATATLISASSSISVSVTRAFRSGCSRSAAATSFTTIAVMPIRGVAPASFSRARSSTSGLTSSSSTEVSCAAVWRLDDHARRDRAAPPAQRDRAARPSARRPRTAACADRAACRPRRDVAVDDAPARARARDLARVARARSRAPSSSARARGETSGAVARPGVAAPARAARTGARPLAPRRLRAPSRRRRARCSRGTGCRVLVGASRRRAAPLASARTPRGSRRSAPTGAPIGTFSRARRAGAASPPSRPRPRPSSCRSRARRRPRRLDLGALGDEPLGEEDVLGVRAELRHDHGLYGQSGYRL